MAEDPKPSLLIVDDDPLITDTLSFALGKDFEVLVSDSRRHAVSLLRQLDDAPQLALVDLGLPPLPHRPDEGFQLITDLLAHSPAMKILVLSGQNDAANARHARTLGAAEFVAKPCDPENLKKILLHALQFRNAEISGEGVADTDPLIGKSPALQKLKSQISQYADSPFPALIEGESGTGKEVVANLLHRLSVRRSKPWFALNCAAIAPNLVEPTLFGYAKGAFTGATQNKSGYFEDAGDGTLFLDEIGELPLAAQAKLLRVLEERKVTRLGGNRSISVEARVVAATNRDLEAEVAAGRFRQDLYFRLSVHVLRVPPLRDRLSDVPELASAFVAAICERFRIRAKQLSGDALELLMGYDWSRNNVRELRNIIERMIIAADGEVLRPEHVPVELQEQSRVRVRPASIGRDFHTLKAEAERQIVVAALERNDWHITCTADDLGLADHASLLKIMRRLDLRKE